MRVQLGLLGRKYLFEIQECPLAFVGLAYCDLKAQHRDFDRDDLWLGCLSCRGHSAHMYCRAESEAQREKLADETHREARIRLPGVALKDS